jgi:hypothetical protein
MQKKTISAFLRFASFKTRSFPIPKTGTKLSRQNCFAKILQNMTKLTKWTFLTSKHMFLASKHTFLTSKSLFLTSKWGLLFYSICSLYTEYKKHVLFHVFRIYGKYCGLIGSKYLQKIQFDSNYNWIFDYVCGTHCLSLD